jgi:hypothetical protein
MARLAHPGQCVRWLGRCRPLIRRLHCRMRWGLLSAMAAARALGASVESAPRLAPAMTTGWCNDSDGVVTATISRLRELAVATTQRDTGLGSQLHLMAVSPASITYVTDTTACRRAAEAARRLAYGADTGSLTAGYLIRYGDQRYLASSRKRFGEWMGWIVFDSSFVALASVAW